MLFAVLADASVAVADTAARSQKIALLAAALGQADSALDVELAVLYLSGELRQRKTGLGYASLRERPAAADGPTLTVAEVDAALERAAGMSGAGSQAGRRAVLSDLLGRATSNEQRLLIGLIGGEMRQGALGGIMVEAVSKAAGLPAASVRSAVTLRGALAPVAMALLTDGPAALEQFRLQVGRPLKPMLAQPADGIGTALARVSPAAVEWKLDGVRVQVHRSGHDVRVFTRTLDDITERVPEIVEAVAALPATSLVLDGEAIALHEDGRPLPFQVTASRVGSQRNVTRAAEQTPLSLYVFDVLHRDGADLVGSSGAERWAVLETVVSAELLVPRIVTDDEDKAAEFMATALAHGHEGVVVKSLDVPYEAGRRGTGWLKVKPRHTLDLVVLAVEWGHGRRRGWLSNLHLGARDSAGGFVMLGKTFKGLTDAMLTWQTERLQELAVSDDGWQVTVRPELVVEVAFDGVQTSPRYPAGMALRFARVLRYRPDKTATEADTIETVRAIYEGPARQT